MSWLKMYRILWCNVCVYNYTFLLPVLASGIYIQTKCVDILWWLMKQAAFRLHTLWFIYINRMWTPWNVIYMMRTFACACFRCVHVDISSLYLRFMFLVPRLMPAVCHWNWQAHLESLLQGPYNQQQHHSLLWNEAIWRGSWQRADEYFQCIKAHVKAREFYYSLLCHLQWSVPVLLLFTSE